MSHALFHAGFSIRGGTNTTLQRHSSAASYQPTVSGIGQTLIRHLASCKACSWGELVESRSQSAERPRRGRLTGASRREREPRGSEGGGWPAQILRNKGEASALCAANPDKMSSKQIAVAASAPAEAEGASRAAGEGGKEVEEEMVEEMVGTLFRWGQKGAQVAFLSSSSPTSSSSSPHHQRHVIFIGGLFDGLLATRYLPPLASALDSRGWSLVQTLLTSSHAGFGTSSLQQDAEELEQLIKFLVMKKSSQRVVLIGHSTGCQDIVHFMRVAGDDAKSHVKGAVLQAPVSDREFFELDPDPEPRKFLQAARELIDSGHGEELLPRAANKNAPITAYRFASLSAVGGDDDLFSSDFSDSELESKLRHMAAIPCLVLFSGADEYVPPQIDKRDLSERLCAAMGGAELFYFEDGNHGLTSRTKEAVEVISDFISKLAL